MCVVGGGGGDDDDDGEKIGWRRRENVYQDQEGLGSFAIMFCDYLFA